jgi:hypothetical protein
LKRVVLDRCYHCADNARELHSLYLVSGQWSVVR